MVRGYHVYNADIWASVVGEELKKMTNSILANHCCSVNLAYFYSSHFPQARYGRRLTGVDGSTGVWKAVRRLEITNAITCSPPPCVQLPVQNLTLKFRLFYFRTSRLHTKHSTVQKFPAIRYITYLI